MLRPRPGPWPSGQHGRSRWCGGRAVDRRARHPVDHAYVPYRRCGFACGGGGQRHGENHRFAEVQQPEVGPAQAGPPGGGVAFRRAERDRRQRSRTRALQGAVRRHHRGQGRCGGQAGPDRGQLGPAYPSDRHRGGRRGALHRLPRRRHRAEPDRRTHRPGVRGGHRPEASRRPGEGPASDRAPGRRQGPRAEVAGYRHRRAVLPAGRCHRVDSERRRSGRGRRDRAYPAGKLEDPRHHRWPAARGRSVRGAQAEGAGDPGRAFGHRQLRQGHQGQATSGHQGRRRQRARGADSQVASGHRVRGRACGEGRNRRRRRAESA